MLLQFMIFVSSFTSQPNSIYFHSKTWYLPLTPQQFHNFTIVGQHKTKIKQTETYGALASVKHNLGSHTKRSVK